MKNRKYRIYGNILYYILKLVSKTLKVKIIKSKKIDSTKSYVYGFWHNKLVAATLCLQDVEKRAVLASPSKDGELISVPLEKLGYKMVRGSSGKDSVKSLRELIKLLSEGYNAGTPLDGPKGPIYEVKGGMIYLAQKSRVALLPVGAAYEKKWIFKKAWDKFEFPKPFSKMVCVVGEPIVIPEDANLEEYRDEIRDKVLEVDEQAKKELNKM